MTSVKGLISCDVWVTALTVSPSVVVLPYQSIMSKLPKMCFRISGPGRHKGPCESPSSARLTHRRAPPRKCWLAGRCRCRLTASGSGSSPCRAGRPSRGERASSPCVAVGDGSEGRGGWGREEKPSPTLWSRPSCSKLALHGGWEFMQTGWRGRWNHEHSPLTHRCTVPTHLEPLGHDITLIDASSAH